MLRPQDEAMHTALKGLFDSILLFARAQDNLYMSLLEQKAAARLHARAVDAKTRKGAWGTTGEVSDAQLGGVFIEARFTEQLHAAVADYKRRFGVFFALVREHTSYDLAFLAFRLDFNEHYEMSLAVAAAEDDDGSGAEESGAPA